jgi:multidrug efflux pump subunit AcrB
MTFLEFPIRRYQFTLVAFMCLIALGWFAFSKVPREEDPYFKIPGYTIAAIYPGADPKDLERLVSKPIEDRIAALDDVMKMETSIRDGVSFTAVEFETFVDADKKFDEVTREVNALRPEMPPETQIIIRRFSPGLVNTIQIALVSDDAPYRELEDYARRLKDTLKTVERSAHLRELGLSLARACASRSTSSACRSSISRRRRCWPRCRARTPTSPPDSSISGRAAFR